jgi:hypothetical protein
MEVVVECDADSIAVARHVQDVDIVCCLHADL